ncbi:MAG TPA: hypothetical protein VIH59_25430 [Candidatus Tectomicrobia bacterium]
MQGDADEATRRTSASPVRPAGPGRRGPLRLPYAEHLAAVISGGYGATIVQVYTDASLIGIGEYMTRLEPKVLRAIVEDLMPLLCGRDPPETEVRWEWLYGTMMHRGHIQGFFIETLSGGPGSRPAPGHRPAAFSDL